MSTKIGRPTSNPIQEYKLSFISCHHEFGLTLELYFISTHTAVFVYC